MLGHLPDWMVLGSNPDLVFLKTLGCTCDDLSAHDTDECLLVFVLSDVQRNLWSNNATSWFHFVLKDYTRCFACLILKCSIVCPK